MKVLITGGAGFLGRRVARALDALGRIDATGTSESIDEIVLLDIVEARDLESPRMRSIAADLGDRAVLESVIDTSTQLVVHLAAAVSGAAEADFDLGMRVNVDATRTLLEVCRARGHRPRVVFSSSVAVYGGELPDVVLESTVLNPQASYGVQKAIGELLIGEYTRKGFLDGRALRLPTVTVRPGRPNAAASSFASGIIREPLHGQPAVCPVPPQARLWITSPATVTAGLVHACALPSAAIGTRRFLNMPGLTLSVRDMVAALTRVAGAAVAERIVWTPDPRIERLVETWPWALDASRALGLGFPCDTSFDEIVRAYQRDSVMSGIAGA